MNRTMGLLDFYPKTLVAPVVERIRFVHELVCGNSVASQPGRIGDVAGLRMFDIGRWQTLWSIRRC